MDIDNTTKKYAVTEAFLANGKQILITGACGNWGEHFAIGMALASQCDLVLADTKSQEKEMEAIVSDINQYNLPIRLNTYLIEEGETDDRYAFYDKMETLFGKLDAIMDVAAINTAGGANN